MYTDFRQSIWKKRFGTGWGALFGLPFFLAGVFFFYSVLTTDSINGEYPSISTRLIFLGFISIFILLGFSIITYFKRIVIDKTERSVKSQWGILFTFKSKTTPLHEITAVGLVKEVRSSGSGSSRQTRVVFPVRLLSKGENIDVDEPTDIIKARSLAEELAKFLGLPMHDSSRGNEVIRQADQLDQNVAKRLKSTGEMILEPVVDPSMASRVETTSSSSGQKQVSISYPSLASQYLWQTAMVIVILVSMLGVLGWQLKDLGLSSENILWDTIDMLIQFSVIIPFILAYIMYRILHQVLASWEFIISSDTLILVRRIFGIRFKINLKNSEIEELDVKVYGKSINRGHIHLVTDRQQISFAHGQQAAELEFAQQMILYMMK